ncbi:MAG: peroxiredoxin [Brevundimonas diminuta]|uniref:thioredoxin-dependent peroxiredoxin n=1 Tax=Brevundimonas diminuta TaxID=293 RepID=A0A1Z3M1D9_BREDI|nr:peroxiredoxin [Brevundimonas diminuta]ASD28271.1 peroxiredoxin [Brevundimonas diminuta]MBD3820084.1 peroxiredoxin [Brevundimonas diminuta]MBI2248989.1 peroxiredoxin [Brevundimonas diminuta]
MTDITENTPAPAFNLATDGGGRVSLDGLKGKNVVLYFYPKADTPGCTTEGQDFSALIDRFSAADAVVIGVSRDTVKKLDRFKAKHDLKVVLGSDEDGVVTEAWGVWVQKKLYGREYMGIERATFLIDSQGAVRRAWRNVKVKGHAEEVLAAVEAL